MNETRPLVQLEWDRARELLEAAQTIVTLSHVRPDGDAVGSLMGLTLALREHDKIVTPIIDGGMNDRFMFVPNAQDILDNVPEGLNPDLIISTDASDLERLGKPAEILRAKGVPLIQLDHHQTNLLFGDVNLVDARTAAAAEGVMDWLDQLGWKISTPVAQALLTGIVTDTLCFRTSSVTPQVMGKAQRLMECGADLVAIVQVTLARQPTSLFHLYGSVLPRLRLEDEIIWVIVTQDDYRTANMELGEYNGLSGYLIQSEDAAISVVFKELEDKQVEVSFRAVPGYDVSQIALGFGGGGHILASGCTLKNMLVEEAVEKVLPLVKAEAARGERIYK